MITSRQHLLELLAEKSFRLGQFKLSSGGTSDYYIDCRKTTLDAEGARLTGRVVLDAIRAYGWNPQAIGGMTLGADPIVVAAALLSAQQLQMRSSPVQPDLPARRINGFLVRKEDKAHGTAQRIEGFCEPGAPVVIVDDVCTTGASTSGAIEAAVNAGMKVIGVLCLVEREDAGGRAKVEQVAHPAPFAAIFKASEVRAEHERQLKTQAANL
ncbi:MAG TPA: orotate phosphoribosyltransferase [Terriglobales bacterium]|jgi:orotate phosphoribosyltransferase|nr:orotate phosphoribosyltransferase [Terriglobales bacterium]